MPPRKKKKKGGGGGHHKLRIVLLPSYSSIHLNYYTLIIQVICHLPTIYI